MDRLFSPSSAHVSLSATWQRERITLCFNVIALKTVDYRTPLPLLHSKTHPRSNLPSGAEQCWPQSNSHCHFPVPVIFTPSTHIVKYRMILVPGGPRQNYLMEHQHRFKPILYFGYSKIADLQALDTQMFANHWHTVVNGHMLCLTTQCKKRIVNIHPNAFMDKMERM